MDFKDLSAPKIEKIDFDLDRYGYALCVVDTGGNHADLTGEYAAIPAEMKRVAKALGGEVLREVSEEEFYKKIPELRKRSRRPRDFACDSLLRRQPRGG